jgi:TRAP-type mannitol/chloroaromatic compound transport system substrate-binding protein
MMASLQSGVLDAAEFVGPGTDIALGLYRTAPFYYGPGFNKPNGTGECIVSLKAWEAADSATKAIVSHACAVEASYALSEMERLNAEALAALTTRNNVQVRSFPADIVGGARREAASVLGEIAARGDLARRVHESYVGFRERTTPWSRISLKAVLDARDG